MLAFRLLVVVADHDLRHRLTRALEQDGFAVQSAPDIASTLAPIDAIPDAMIIEQSLPDGDSRELRQALRARGLLRRAHAGAPTTFGPLRLDPVTQDVHGEAGAVALTPTEFRVLTALAERRGTIIGRRDLVRAAWPAGASVSDNSLDQYIARVRGKLRRVTADAAIVTTRGIGYRLE
jgi:two-component system response regulator MprA